MEGQNRFRMGISIALILSLGFALGYAYGHGSSEAPIVIEKCSSADTP
jgi:hypothetical protein